jgi:hypothetical protein
MRKLLLSAAAGAPLLLLAAGPALADTTIGSTTTPVKTSTANGGQPDNVIIGSGATVNPPGANTVAVTMDSSNVITNNGAVSLKDQDGSTAIQLNGGLTGSLSNNGSISNTESYTRTDTNNDGVLDGDWAKGTGRYGVHLTSGGPLVGNIINAATGSIAVQGNNSFGIALDSQLQGDLQQAGSLSVIGDSSVALIENNGVTGKVLITGATSVTGKDAVGVNLQGDVGGPFSIYSVVSATGYSTTTRSVDPAINSKLISSDLQISGPAVQIGADMMKGVFLGAPPAGTVATDTTTDKDGDGVVDSAEATGSVTTFGSAPAIQIGSGTRDVHLYPYGTGITAYGLILEGNVTGNGVFDGNAGNAIKIGGSGGHTVTIDGIHIASTSTVTAQGYVDGATGIHLLQGASVSNFLNEGGILATTNTSNADQATALLIDAGASLPVLVNSGAISGTVTGDLGNAAAIVDKSGTLASITNTNTINASTAPTGATDVPTGKTVALDLSANTSGVTLIQNPNAASTSTNPITPKINGDIILGSGYDLVQFNAGTVIGTLDFGQGSGSLLIDGGASYTGKLLATGSSGALDINVKNGLLEDDSSTALKVGNLNVGSQGQLTVSADPINNVATQFNVAGTATLADGAKVNVKLQSLIPLNSPGQSFTIISSPGGLTVGSGASLAANTPYLFIANFTPNTTNGTLTLDLRRRLASEANLNQAETAAWDPVYANLGLNSGIQRAFLAQTDEAGYRSMLNQVLPDYAGGVFRALSWASEQQGIAAGDPPKGEDQSGPTRAWTQEIVLDETKKIGQTSPYDIVGVGVVAGLESVSPKGSALGMKIGFTTADIKNPSAPGDNLLGASEINGGVYWRGGVGALRADAQLGAGFIWVDDRREFLFSDDQGVVHQTAHSNWTGYTISARAGLQYTATMGAFFIEPQAHVDYFRLHQSGYSETGGGTGFDMKVNSRDGDIFTVTGSVIAGMTFGNTGFRWRPQIEVGYRAVLAGNAGSTTTEFIGGSDPFTLAAETVKLNSAIGRVGLRLYSDYLDVLLDAGAAYNKDYTDIDVHLTARTVF